MASTNPAAGGGESSSTKHPSPETTTFAEVSSFDDVPWPVRPSVGINYNFVFGMYLGGSLLALLFYTLEKQTLAPLLIENDGNGSKSSLASNEIPDAGAGDGADDGDDPWKEFAKGMEGIYFIFLPFIPCLVWSLIVRHYWLKENIVSQEKKEN